MLDRFGNLIYVAYAPHELVWIRAALMLTGSERAEAYRDISGMTGRSFVNIREKANDLRTRDRIAASLAASRSSRHYPAPVLPKPVGGLPVAPDGFIRALTKERLMGAR